VESHLTNLTTRGLDVYGPKKTAHWLANIDTRTGAPPAFEHIPKRVYRKIGAPRGSSLYWDLPSVKAALRLSRITGKPCYADAARDYVRAFLDRGVDENGLFLWGNHRYYDVFEDRTVHFSGGYHELRPHTPAWDLLWEAAPNTVERAIRVMAARHLHSPAIGGFNRHDNGKREHAFLEAGAVMVESLAWLHHKTGDPALLDQALKMARYSFNHRGKTTGLLINNPDTNRWDFRVCTTEVGLWANACIRSAQLTGNRAFMAMARDAVAAYLKYGYDTDTRQYVGQLRVTDGSPVIPKERGYWPRAHADAWNPDQWPTHDYPLSLAQACLTLYQETKASMFLEGVRRWADIVSRSTPSDRTGAYAGQYGHCIRFMHRAGRQLREERYLAVARALADEAVERLQENGWFMGYADSHLYEAVDGVGYLLQALMDLEQDA
jgi:hypothetical protein